MTRSEITAHNHGIGLVVDLAVASAKVLRARLTERPTRFSYAIAALDALAEAGAALMLPVPPDHPPEASAGALPRPVAPAGSDGAMVAA